LPPARTDVVRKWTAEELAAAWANGKSDRDPKRGKALFAEARCIVCHRAGGPGGVSGPDLTSVARRFSPRDILTSIIEPSKVIDEKYAAEVLELADGRIVTGRIAPGDYRSPDLEVVTNLLEPQKTVKVAKADVAHREPSPVSAMPSGLQDGFRQDEILDLLAFLLAAERAPP
jgi:putative heme-binding domain-containing protein